jgi:hypothetical protein
LGCAEGSIGALQWSGVADPAGVKEQGTHTWGLPRNLGDPVVSGPVRRSGVRHEDLQALVRRARARRERTSGAGHGTAKRRERSAAERTAGSRSAS